MTSDPTADAQRDAMRAAMRRIDPVNDWLRVGGAVPAAESQRLADAGVTHVVDLRQDTEFEPADVAYSGVTRTHVPVPNHGAPTLQQLRTLNEWLAEQQPGAVLVHCAGGFGRAATMAVGLLVHRGASVDEAEAQVRAARTEIRINDDQRAWLRAVEEQRSAQT